MLVVRVRSSHAPVDLGEGTNEPGNAAGVYGTKGVAAAGCMQTTRSGMGNRSRARHAASAGKATPHSLSVAMSGESAAR
jgi:hypothetical protein